MKKRNFMMALAMTSLCTMAQAQVVASLGFEDSDAYYHNPDSSQFASFHADHINLYSGDVWNEKNTAEVHSGTYALEAVHVNTVAGNTWDRGLKLRGLEIEPETSYRVSFWVKANNTYTMDGSSEAVYTKIKSTLSVGIENLEAPFVSQGGTEFYYNWTDGVMTGAWRRLSFVSYFSGWDVQNKVFDNYNNNIREVVDGDTIYWGAEYSQFPEEFFLTINMYNPGTYYLDDILVEKATMAGCYYNYDAIKVDFGYPTNIALLASASTDPIGVYLLSNSCVKVMNGDQEMEVSTVELKEDGYMYIFLTEELDEATAAGITVSFTPDADCPIIYNTDRRPSMDVDSEMTVLAFENEAIYLDETIEELSYVMDGPNFLSSEPEDHSFELDPATFSEVRVTYDRPVSTEIASILLMQNGVTLADLWYDTVVDSEDPNTLVVTVGTLDNGEYQLVLTNITNAMSGFESLTSQTITFSVGPDTDDSTSEVIYDGSDFLTAAAGTFPKGWLSNDDGTIHQYGVNDDGSIWNYNYGSTPGGGGCRLFTGFTGDATSWLYWRATNSTVGTLTYGEQVKDYVMADGSIDPDMDPDVALYLEPRKYQVTFRMAAWKVLSDGSYPMFDFSLEKIDIDNLDADGEVVAQFTDVEAKPSVEGVSGVEITGSTLASTEFTVNEEGYYMIKFSCQSTGGYHEFLLGGVELITRPSDAAYYKGQLQTAIDSATVVLAMAADEAYAGDTKTALEAALAEAQGTTYTAPSAIESMNELLYSLCGAMLNRITYVDNFAPNLQTLIDNLASIDAASKYVMSDEYVECEAVRDEYEDVEISLLDDEALAEAAERVEYCAGLSGNIVTIVDVLTYRLTLAAQTARLIGAEPESAILDAESAVTDDDAVANTLNGWNTYKIYQILAEDGAISEDLMTSITSETEADESGSYIVLSTGLELTGYVKNPNFYTYCTSTSDTITQENTPGWETIEGFAHMRDGYLASTTQPVAKSMLNLYKGQYNIAQTISGLPVGIYDVHMRTRTADGRIGVNDETGIPDMYIWASTAEGDTVRVQFEEGSAKYNAQEGFPTVIKNVSVGENTVLSIGAKEAYTSGKNYVLDDDGNATEEDNGIWDTNTYVNDVRLMFVGPLPGYDYSEALLDVREVKAADPVSYEYYTVGGIKLDRPAKGVNIVKVYRADGTVSVQKMIVK